VDWSEGVSERSRYQLTGGIFLVALAVIVLPMLFDGSGVRHADLAPVAPIEPDPTPVEPPKIDDGALASAAAVRERVDDEGFDSTTGVRVGEPQLRNVDDAQKAPVEAWAVQLASFGDPAKATALRDQLRKDGYSALLSDAKKSGTKITRVAVGPVIERAEADRLRAELARRYAKGAIVVRFEQ
jgi:DedD protein